MREQGLGETFEIMKFDGRILLLEEAGVHAFIIGEKCGAESPTVKKDMFVAIVIEGGEIIEGAGPQRLIVIAPPHCKKP